MRTWMVACLVLSGCTCGAEAPSPSASDPATPTEPTEPTEPAGPVPAFLVYGVTSTAVVALADGAVTSAEGAWLASLDAPRTVVHRVVPRSSAAEFGVAECACGTVEDACLGRALQRVIHTDRGFDVAWERRCPCWSLRDETRWPEQPSYPVNGAGESLEPCHDELGPAPAVSLVSGALYTSDWGSPMNEPCARESESSNAYDLWGEELVLTAVPRRAFPAGGPRECADGEFDWRSGVSGLSACVEEGDYGFDYDSPCRPDAVDMTFPFVRDGRWCRVEVGVESAGQASRCATCVDARPDACPSALDPCGDPAPFSAATRGAQMFWVSTDGSHALVFGGDGAVLHAADGARRAVELAADGIIGVLFHPDARGILAAMAHDFAPPAVPEPAACEEDASCGDGQLCMNEVCLPRCTSDDDCDTRGQCGARCVDGRCGPLPDGTCSEAFPCEGGFVCRDGACEIPEGQRADYGLDELDDDGDTSGLVHCSSDMDCGTGMCVGYPSRCQALPCEEDRTPRQWAEACSRQRREGELGSASGTCRCALEAATGASTVGAVLYELGRVAEADGRPSDAREYYRQSLAERPNRVVQERLDALPR